MLFICLLLSCFVVAVVFVNLILYLVASFLDWCFCCFGFVGGVVYVDVTCFCCSSCYCCKSDYVAFVVDVAIVEYVV